MNRKWSIRADGYTIQDEAGNIVCRFFNREEEDYLNHKENSLLVIKAVNNHNQLVEALQEISEGKGRFRLDPHEHCRNTVEDMKELAVNALKSIK